MHILYYSMKQIIEEHTRNFHINTSVAHARRLQLSTIYQHFNDAPVNSFCDTVVKVTQFFTIILHVSNSGGGVEHSGSGVELRTLDYESCAAVLKPWARCFTLHCSSSISYINEYLAIDKGGYVYEQPSRFNCSIWLDASWRS